MAQRVRRRAQEDLDTGRFNDIFYLLLSQQTEKRGVVCGIASIVIMRRRMGYLTDSTFLCGVEVIGGQE
jgi:hypothetical protein